MDAWNDFSSKLSALLKKHSRYKPEAYLFVMESLDHAIQRLQEARHISGSELLKEIRDEAEQQFGPMAETVFAHWGIKNSLDFGQLVFNMVQEGILSKSESDVMQDFYDRDFFQKLFDVESSYRLQENPTILKKFKN